jgi:hypothetical protein
MRVVGVCGGQCPTLQHCAPFVLPESKNLYSTQQYHTNESDYHDVKNTVTGVSVAKQRVSRRIAAGR